VKLIVGLGNPGNEYKVTRHNIGFLVVDYLSIEKNISLQKRRFRSVFGSGVICGCKVIIAKPLTFMNLSGEAVSTIANYYNIASENIIVIHDDMDIEFGQLKIKKHGGSAGHLGIESIIKYLKEDNFLRIRTGIGKPPDNIDPSDFVLQKFSSKEQSELKEVINNIQNCIELVLTQGPEAAMSRFHSSSQTVL
jgi:PTH1 family peptidyl-tRNA hydrolase